MSPRFKVNNFSLSCAHGFHPQGIRPRRAARRGLGGIQGRRRGTHAPRARRLVYSAKSELLQHHNASFTVSAHGSGSRVVWVADLLPDAAAGPIGAMMEQGVAAMRKTLGG